MGSIGETFRQARLDKGVSLAEAERDTRIRRKYLEALEAEDYAALPAPVYSRGFIRTYASYLGLPAEAMVDLYNQARAREERPVLQPALPQIERPSVITLRHVVTALGAIGVIVLLALFGTWYNSAQESIRQAEQSQFPSSVGQSPTLVPVRSAVRTPTPVPPTPTPSPTPSPTPIQGLVVDLRLTGRSWVQVWVDGEQTLQETLQAGASRTFQAERSVRLRVSNAGALTVTVNGTPQPALGAPGQAVEAEWGRSS